MNDLKTHGLVRIPYPAALRQTVRDAAGSWRQFCELPSKTKERFAYADEGRLDGTGYELKVRHGATLDIKETLQATSRALPMLEGATHGPKGVVARPFLSDAWLTLDAVTPFVLELAEAVECTYGLAGLASEVRSGRLNWFLRYLHYFGGRAEGAEIASAHVDKAGLTLHLHETDMGLQYLEFPGSDIDEPRWREMPVTEHETVVIPGMQMQYRSDGQLKALCHRVTANSRTAVNGRFSIVCFIPLLQTPMFNKLGLGRLQEYPPGFNYSMPNDDFRELFA